MRYVRYMTMNTITAYLAIWKDFKNENSPPKDDVIYDI